MKDSFKKIFIMLTGFIICSGTPFFLSEIKAEQKVYTNQDIEKYKSSSDKEPQVTKKDKSYEKYSEKMAEKKEKTQKAKEEREKEYWCKKANQYRKKIEMAKEDIALAEKQHPQDSGILIQKKRSVRKERQTKINASTRKLSSAEKDLAELEQEAHRKGIPPGWLRCQFE